MAYFTGASLSGSMGERAYLQCLDPDNTTTADATLLAAIQARADAYCDGFFGRNYSIAAIVANPPPMVGVLALAVGAQFAYMTKPEFLVDGKTPVQAHFDWAVATLKAIGKGEFRLDVDSAPEKPANVRAGGVRTGTYDNTAVGYGFIKDGTGSGGY